MENNKTNKLMKKIKKSISKEKSLTFFCYSNHLHCKEEKEKSKQQNFGHFFLFFSLLLMFDQSFSSNLLVIY